MSQNQAKIGLVLILLSYLWLYSCEYEPHRVYNRTVEEDPGPPQITVVELNLDHDSIWLYNYKTVSFRFQSDIQKIKTIRFLIDDNEVNVSETVSGTYTLDYGGLTDGLHTLEMQIITGSGTGSIAEILGAEGYAASKLWTLVVDKDFYSEIDSNAENGYLKFSWKRYCGYDLNEYIIYRMVGWNNKVEIARTTSLSYTDISYAGEAVRYEVEVSTDEYGLFPWGYLELSNDIPTPFLSVSENNEYVVKWNKSKYYNAIDTFAFLLNAGNEWNFKRTKSTLDPDDTTYNASSLLFGDHVDFKLQVIPKNNIQYSPSYYYLFESPFSDVYIGYSFKNRIENYYHITQVSPDEFIYISGCDSLVRYSVSQKRIVDRLSYQPSYCSMCKFVEFMVSPSGKYLSTHVDCDSKVMLTRSVDLKDSVIRDLNYLSEQNVFTKVPVSDVNTGIVNNSDRGFYIYDFITSATLGFYRKGINCNGNNLSGDGKYIFVTDDSLRLVHFDNSDFTDIWKHSLSDIPEFYGFDGTNVGKLVIWDGSVLSVKNCSDFSDLYTFPLTDENILNIDFHNGEMLTCSAGHLFVRSYTDGSLIKDIPVTMDPANWYYSCILVNHTVICQTGVMYFVN